MQITEFNNHLRSVFVKIREEGFKTNDLTKLIFPGMSSQISRFIRSETNFGIKPLTTIGSQIEYDIHIVAIKRDDPDSDDLKSRLEKGNIAFFEDMHDKTVDYLSDKAANPESRIRNSVNKVTIDEILNDLSL